MKARACGNVFFPSRLDIDECSADTSPCDRNANCTNSNGSYSCTCKQGYAGDGITCTGLYLPKWEISIDSRNASCQGNL